MYKRVFDIHGWKLSTHAFNEGDIRLYESLTSIGNGYMGMRGNFEEGFSGDSHTGTYIAGIWFPDKTRVGWWKNGYPKYFGKVINAVNFAAIGVEINGKTVDLHTSNFSDLWLPAFLSDSEGRMETSESRSRKRTMSGMRSAAIYPGKALRTLQRNLWIRVPRMRFLPAGSGHSRQL